MSILTFLLFTSFLYLAVADPIAETSTESLDQERLDKFMEAVEEAYDEHFAPILVGLSQYDRSYLKITTLDGVGSFMNYCLLRAKQTDSKSGSRAVDDSILMNLNSADTFPAVACQQPPSCEEEEKEEPSE